MPAIAAANGPRAAPAARRLAARTPTGESASQPNSPAQDGAAQPDEAQFAIAAAESLQQRRPRILKQGDTFGVFDPNGDAIAFFGGADGLYHRDTRFLSQLYLTINGTRPILLSSTLRDSGSRPLSHR